MNELPVFLMSPPRHDWTLKGKANFLSEEFNVVSPQQARAEWAALATAITDAGGEVIVCPPNPKANLTGLIYTAEAGEYFADRDEKGHWILPNMAVEHRRSEAAWVGGFMEGLGLNTVSLNSTWEAQGDVLRADGGERVVHTFGSGKYKRTAPTAYEEVAHRFGDAHIQIHFHADPWFHGNTFLNFYRGSAAPQRLLDDGPRVPHLALVCEEALMPGEMERLERFLPDTEFVVITPEESRSYDTNSLQVGEHVIATDQLSRTAETAFLKLGLEIVKLDLSELFSKGGGAPVCLTNRLWGFDLSAIPEHVLWSMHPDIAAHTSI